MLCAFIPQEISFAGNRAIDFTVLRRRANAHQLSRHKKHVLQIENETHV